MALFQNKLGFLAGSRTSSIQGTQLHANAPHSRGSLVIARLKKDFHPQIYKGAKVICNGEEVMTVNGTKEVYNVDIYSGNHPFYLGQKKAVVLNNGQISKFRKRYAGNWDAGMTDREPVSAPATKASKPASKSKPKAQQQNKSKPQQQQKKKKK